jgi:guanylate kinase
MDFMTGKSVIFSAPSGAGKTTIVKQLLQRPELRLEFSISACSRPPRIDEQHGKDYYFLDIIEFRKKIAAGEFVEWEEVYQDNYYGTLKSELTRIWNKDNIVVFDVDVKGGMNLKKIFDKNTLAIYVMPPSVKELEHRLRTRGTESEDKIQQRLTRADYELSLASNFDVKIVNDDLKMSVERAYNEINNFIN